MLTKSQQTEPIADKNKGHRYTFRESQDLKEKCRRAYEELLMDIELELNEAEDTDQISLTYSFHAPHQKPLNVRDAEKELSLIKVENFPEDMQQLCLNLKSGRGFLAESSGTRLPETLQ